MCARHPPAQLGDKHMINIQKIGLQFTEEMSGFMSLGAISFQDGHERGKLADHALMVHLTIRTDDLDTFLTQPEHHAQAIGYIESGLIGGRRPVLEGSFNLFAPSGDINRRTMRYRLYFELPDGRQMTLSGTKQVQDNLGPDLWQDTTTLYANVFSGFVSEADEAHCQLYAAGILHISLPGFIHQLTTFRADAPTSGERLAALERFGGFFLGSLWKLYGPNPTHCEAVSGNAIAQRTLDGVRDCTVSTHYAQTEDGLGISLLRFTRASSRDVVLLVPGLTASSDMFFMPEHRNLTQTLLDAGYGDVWILDGRISNRHPYNLTRHRFNVDDVALYDNPAALATVRRAVGPEARIHIIAQCLGALSIAMSVFGRIITDVASVIVNGVALTPKVNRIAGLKLKIGPFLCESLLGLDCLDPRAARRPGISPGKLLGKCVSLLHHECNVPECHMTSFMWGYGFPVLYRHENLHDLTHRRIGDLFGGSGMNYYRHIRKMVEAGNRAVKYLPGDPRYQSLPDDYFTHARDIETPFLFVAGQDNALFSDSNMLCHQRLESLVPGRHELLVVPGYGHADIFIGKNAAVDIFPKLLDFLEKHGSQTMSSQRNTHYTDESSDQVQVK